MHARSVATRAVVAASLAAAAALAGSSAISASQGQNPISDLAGRWAGMGTVRWKNGNEQPYKCTVTYFLGDNDTRVKQTMRCHSAEDFRVEIATLMQVDGENITGTWEERTSSMTGTVSGKVRPKGYEALAQNQFFKAAFEIEMPSACEQQVTIRPSREISMITANLRKC